jgi:hypothetical protein
MSVTPVTRDERVTSPSTREDSRGFTELSVSERIRILAASGLKPRDISVLLNVHERMVVMLLDKQVTV